MDLNGKDDKGRPVHHIVDLFYPEIYAKEKTTLTVGLRHTRAADDIRVSYDSERDGWVIEQASTFEWEVSDPVCDPDWQEVAFVQAWGRAKEETSGE